jgi:hypothetical protein
MKERGHRNRFLFLIFAGAIGLVLMVIEGYQLISFSDSVVFCGQLCHRVMTPEFTTYQASPHSRVLCADCHVGSGASYLVKSKVNGIPMIWGTLTGNYERPIPVPVRNLRPARETCEECHRPEKFTGDLVKVHNTYLTDESNTMSSDQRVLRIGGASGAIATGIHWHISAKVWYLPLDEKRQQIGWMGVEGTDGNYVREFTDPLKMGQITPQTIEKGKRLMDCIDCHNRATHIFQSPEELIDTAMTQGRIDTSLPFIKREGARALYPVNSSLDVAYQKIDGISDFYKTNYPKVYSANKAGIDQAINELKDIARLTTFSEMKSTWETYVDNIGHQTSEGCFRCHGKLIETKGANTGRTVDVSCDLCHYPIQVQ